MLPRKPSFLCMLLPLALTACARDTMLLESDIPLPAEMSTVRSAGIRRGAGTVQGGTFLIAGGFDDAAEAMRRSASRFEANGWTIVRAEGSSDHAVGAFAKGARSVDLQLWRRAIEPRMSSGSIVVRTDGSGER